MKKAIISAPFGTYIRLPQCTSTRGTYTLEKRPGAIWGALTRIDFTKEGIYNRMGLRNPGIKSQTKNFEKYSDAIWSIGGLSNEDILFTSWEIPQRRLIEINMSCPNAERLRNSISDVEFFDLITCAHSAEKIIVKLPPSKDALDLIDAAYAAGIRRFHCCNTIKTAKGGLSGKTIQKFSLLLAHVIKGNYPDSIVIGGGGIYTPEDVKRYRDAGADHFALGTIFFTPWKVPAVLHEIYK